MRSRQALMQEYAASHSQITNQIIHMICVPIIFFTSTGLLWSVPLDRLVPIAGFDSDGWFNLATVVAVPIAIYYAMLGLPTLVTGLLWMLSAGLACLALQSAGVSLLIPCAAAWLVAWVVQIYGHKIEGAKPSFFDDLVFLLIGPLFVHEKLVRLITTGSIQPRLRA